MAPRNNDANTSYKKKNYSVEENDSDVQDIVPCLLHKKHKVVKLVRSQIQKIQEEGLICVTAGIGSEVEEGRASAMRRKVEGEEVDMNRTSSSRSMGSCCFCILFLLTLFLIIFLIIWISSGPLSNSIAHTPIPPGSFIRTEGLCSLEKKYLLRWSKPDYFE